MEKEIIEWLKKSPIINYDRLEDLGIIETERAEAVQKAVKRINELKYITNVRIEEEFETSVDTFERAPENRLTITIDYLDIEHYEAIKKHNNKYEYHIGH